MAKQKFQDYYLMPSPIRRWLALMMLSLLSVIMLVVAMQAQTVTLSRIVLFFCGIGGIGSVYLLYQATRDYIILTDQGLELSSGEMLAKWDDMEKADRGLFALKPAQGFSVLLKEPAPRQWRMGLYWRLGRRLGIGGVTDARQAKEMADVITARLAGH